MVIHVGLRFDEYPSSLQTTSLPHSHTIKMLELFASIPVLKKALFGCLAVTVITQGMCKFVGMESGDSYATITGVRMRQRWSAENWDTHQIVSLHVLP